MSTDVEVVDEDDDGPAFRPDPTPLSLLAEISTRLAWANAMLFGLTCSVFALVGLTLLGIVLQMAGCAVGVAK